jgi:hypothetical protein
MEHMFRATESISEADVERRQLSYAIVDNNYNDVLMMLDAGYRWTRAHSKLAVNNKRGKMLLFVTDCFRSDEKAYIMHMLIKRDQLHLAQMCVIKSNCELPLELGAKAARQQLWDIVSWSISLSVFSTEMCMLATVAGRLDVVAAMCERGFWCDGIVYISISKRHKHILLYLISKQLQFPEYSCKIAIFGRRLDMLQLMFENKVICPNRSGEEIGELIEISIKFKSDDITYWLQSQLDFDPALEERGFDDDECELGVYDSGECELGVYDSGECELGVYDDNECELGLYSDEE